MEQTELAYIRDRRAPPAGARRRTDVQLEGRVGVERRYLERVRSALQRRGVSPWEEYAGLHYCVLRFEAPGDALLGLPIELAELTRGRCTYQLQRKAEAP
jgi:hypothetical protein